MSSSGLCEYWRHTVQTNAGKTKIFFQNKVSLCSPGRLGTCSCRSTCLCPSQCCLHTGRAPDLITDGVSHWVVARIELRTSGKQALNLCVKFQQAADLSHHATRPPWSFHHKEPSKRQVLGIAKAMEKNLTHAIKN